jgi:MerR family transcriptional regulator, copper efflux regulator
MAAAAARRPCGERANLAILFISDIALTIERHNLDTSVSGFATLAAGMDALTIHEAAETTGWSARMLRYVERVGLVEPARSAAGYRLYGPAELQRLRTLRVLLAEHDIGLSDVAFARRLREEPALRRDTEAWLEAEAERPDEVPAADWLRFEQEKHQRLLAAVAATN